jgi:formate dehydrogenase
MAKILCVLYPDPITGYPDSYARESIPQISAYPDGQSVPTPERIDFKPGELLGSVSGELGLRAYLEGLGRETGRHGPIHIPFKQEGEMITFYTILFFADTLLLVVLLKIYLKKPPGKDRR